MPKWFASRLFLAAAFTLFGGIATAQTSLLPQPLGWPRLPAPSPAVGPPGVAMAGKIYTTASCPAGPQVFVQCVVMEVPGAVWTKHAATLPRDRGGPGAGAVLDCERAEKLVRAMKGDPAGADILSRPQLLLTDNQTGFFQVGQDVQFPTRVVAGDGTTTQGVDCRPTGITMRVTPRVMPDGKQVTMRVEFQRTCQAASGVNLGNGKVGPAFDSQTVQITAIVPDGKTVVAPVVATDKARHVIVLTPHICRPAAVPAPAAPAPMVTKVFPVLDIVTPIPTADAPADGARPNADKLVKMVAAYCRPDTWQANGGPGSAQFFEVGGALVVNQTPEVIREVEDLLTSLRKLQDVCISSEVRVVSVPAGFCDREKLFAREQPAAGGPVAFLDATRLAAVIAAAQADRRGGVVQAPKVTQFNGQKTSLTVGQVWRTTTGVEVKVADGRVVAEPKMEEVCGPSAGGPGACGLQFSLQTTASADQRFVRLAFTGTVTSVNGPGQALPVTVPSDPVCEGGNTVAHTIHILKQDLCRLTVDRTVAVPTGHTVAILAGTRPRPAADKCPCDTTYLTWRFTPAGPAGELCRDEVLLLVTPRIISSAAEEQAQLQLAARVETAPAPRPAACCAEPCTACRAANPRAAELVAAYRKACADGRTEAATALAVQALALDPTCFAGQK